MKRKICILCETWSSGGIEAYLTNLLCAMDITHLKIDVVAIRQEKSIFQAKLANLGVAFYELSGDRKRLVENRTAFLKLANERCYDVLHINAFHGGMLYYLHLAKEIGIPIRIAHSHCAGLFRNRFYFLKQTVHEVSSRAFVSCATDFLACSKLAAKFMNYDRAGKKYCIIPNGIDCARFCFHVRQRERMRASLGVQNECVIGTIGRLCAEKNQTFLLDIFWRFLKKCPESRLWLIGEGRERKRLESRAEKLGIREKVCFWGNQIKTEALLWAMDLFVFPSIVEGFGIAAVEAQAAGLPVFASDRVPIETQITDLMHRMPLELGADEWASAMWDFHNSQHFDRESYASIVSEKGYDISASAAKIFRIYMGE